MLFRRPPEQHCKAVTYQANEVGPKTSKNLKVIKGKYLSIRCAAVYLSESELTDDTMTNECQQLGQYPEWSNAHRFNDDCNANKVHALFSNAFMTRLVSRSVYCASYYTLGNSTEVQSNPWVLYMAIAQWARVKCDSTVFITRFPLIAIVAG